MRHVSSTLDYELEKFYDGVVIYSMLSFLVLVTDMQQQQEASHLYYWHWY